ncbi:MAG: ParB N-terminal domain-containing protein, partial [Oryzihumus sp.]
MSEKRRALGRGLGALIPSTPAGDGNRPVDVFFKDNSTTATITIDAPRDPAAEAEEGFTGNAEARTGAAESSTTSAADGFTGNTGPAPTAADDLAPVPGARFAELPVRSIRPNPKQPRQVFDEEDMAELVHSIREIGVLQPVVVRAIPAEE